MSSITSEQITASKAWSAKGSSDSEPCTSWRPEARSHRSFLICMSRPTA
jgi:hypothetical protein